MAKKKPARGGRKLFDRELEQLLRKKELLAREGAGGAPERPIAVTSPSQVEPRARTLGCPRCDGELVVDSHDAVVVDGASLRRARCTCRVCGRTCDWWFRLSGPTLN